jgi:periplasmic protein CpxP/Spy
MLQLLHPARSLVAATLLGAALFAGPVAAASTEQLAQANPSQPPKSTAKPKVALTPEQRAEARIKGLHDRLKITPAQETQWNAVAQAMRDSEQSVRQAIEQRQRASALTAIDDLKAYQAISEAHAQGVQKLIPPFQALYAAMSDEQKKNADAYFGQTRKQRRAERAK